MRKRYMDFVPSRPPVERNAEIVRELPVRETGSVRRDAMMRRDVAMRRRTMAQNTAMPQGGTAMYRETAIQGEIPARRAAPIRREPSINVSASINKTVVTSGASSVGFASEKVALGAIEDMSDRFVKKDVPKRPLNNTTGVHNVTGNVYNNAPNVTSGVYNPPRNPFINQEKIQKRPLSKNVYYEKTEKAEPAKEEPKGPVTIITKPEKQAHVSLIVTIILTIILGAAAGTIAFLLLPK